MNGDRMKDLYTDVDAKESVRTLISFLAQALVDHNEAVKVTVSADGLDGLTVVLRVSPVDLGKVIGKQGRTARSIRTILQAASVKHQQRFSLDIEPAAWVQLQ
jgi:predicted RNA-binding protein YlqC (UPF0109 family)